MENTNLTPETIGLPDPEPITLADIFEEKIFEARSLRSPQWLKDSKRFSYIEKSPDGKADTLWTYDIVSGERHPVIPSEYLLVREEGESGTRLASDAEPEPKYLPIHGYQWSPDENEVLLARAPRHRSFGEGDNKIYIYNVRERRMRCAVQSQEKMVNAKWSPDGSRFAYVKGDDLYVKQKDDDKEFRLTHSAQTALYNGRFGWVYEEELYLTDGWSWSPDGKRIAYFQVDERPVPIVPLANYDDLHLKPRETRYPKAGDPNPLIKIGVLDVPEKLEDKPPATRWVDIGNDTDIYIARMQWNPNGDLILQRLPRLQNQIELLRVDVTTGKSRVILTERDKAWLDSPGDIKFVEGKNQFLWSSERTGFKQLYLYDLEGKLLRQVTQGDWDVDAIVGVDHAHRLVYFTAANPNPMERHLFSALLDGGGEITRLTQKNGTHAALFSPDGLYYLNTHSSVGVAPSVRLCRSSGNQVALVQDNPMPKLANRQLGQWEYTTFRTSDGVDLNAAILRPRNFDPAKKHPVLMYTYGGPGSQVVKDAFGGGGWEQMLSQKGYLLVKVDGRGSGGRGRDFMKITYQNLGHWEVNDQIEAAKWLGGLSYVDASRIGIWGWSYGGYMASLCITRGADVFKAAIAVAPVTHWNFYDSIYTERYMRRPQDNPKGYEASAPVTHAEKLKGKFLLVHGTADDNVHFQNAARLAQEFQKRGKPFQTMYYPGKHHGLEGVSMHLYAMLTDFILTNL